MAKYKNKYRIESARAPFWDYGWKGSYFVTIVTKDRVPYFGQIVDGEMQLSPIGEIAHACWLAIPDHFPHVRLGPFVVMPDHVHGIIRITETQHAVSLGPSDVPGASDVTGSSDAPGPSDVPGSYDGSPPSDISGSSDASGSCDGSPPSDAVDARDVPSPSDISGPSDMSGPSDTPGSSASPIVKTQNFASLPPADGCPPVSDASPPPTDALPPPTDVSPPADDAPPSPDPPRTRNRFGPQSRNLGSIVRGYKIGVTKGAREIDPSFAWQPRFHDIIIRDVDAYVNIAKYIKDNPKHWRTDRFDG